MRLPQSEAATETFLQGWVPVSRNDVLTEPETRRGALDTNQGYRGSGCHTGVSKNHAVVPRYTGHVPFTGRGRHLEATGCKWLAQRSKAQG